jgi:hypothetical protein
VAALTLDEPMAKPKPRSLSVKLDADVVESARVAAALRGELISDMLSGLLRPAVARLEEEALDKRTRSRVPAPKGKGSRDPK